MIENAPRQLAALISDWRTVPANSTPESVRGNSSPKGDLAFWRDQAKLISLVQEVEHHLLAIERSGMNVDHLRKHIPALYELLFSFTVPWSSAIARNRRALDDPAFDMLATLGMLVQSQKLEPAWSEEQRNALNSLLDQLDDYLASNEDIDDASQQYLFTLAKELRQAVEEVGRFGTALVRKSSRELAGALLGEVEHANRNGKQRAADFFGKIVQELIIASGKIVATRAIEAGLDQVMPEIES